MGAEKTADVACCGMFDLRVLRGACTGAAPDAHTTFSRGLEHDDHHGLGEPSLTDVTQGFGWGSEVLKECLGAIADGCKYPFMVCMGVLML